MKSAFLILVLFLNFFSVFGQSTVGLIAHWDMNGTVNDVSGNGFDGHQNNLTPAAGKDGIMGHGWYFNGTNSTVTIPYQSSLNVSNFTIAATIKVMGFYAGACHTNMIFNRGTSAGNGRGSYFLAFSDAPAGLGCSGALDTTQDCFMPDACATGTPLAAPSLDSFNYSPHIIENVWYTAVVTFNDTVFKIYVNDTLRSTGTITNPGVSMGTSTDSASIGFCKYDVLSGYPYYFNGVIDDILIYNRVLADSEIAQIDTCGRITLQPTTSSTHIGGNASYTVSSSIINATYQWQQDGGTGFVNLTNSGPYSGVNTNTLTVTGVTSALNSYHYRCLVANSWGCSDTTTSASLTLGVTNVVSNETILVYPNPAKNIISVQVPSLNQSGSLQLMNEVGQLIAESKISGKTTDFDLSDLPNGMYLIRVQCDGQSLYKKILKY